MGEMPKLCFTYVYKVITKKLLYEYSRVREYFWIPQNENFSTLIKVLIYNENLCKFKNFYRPHAICEGPGSTT